MRPMGVGTAQAAKMSKSLVKLGADLGALYNRPVQDALKALQAGLVGQVRPLRQFGVSLDVTRLKAEALRLGLLKSSVSQRKVAEAATAVDIAQAKYAQTLKKYGEGTTQTAQAQNTLMRAQDALKRTMSGVGGTLTANQKLMAAYSIIMHDTAIAHDNFRLTSKNLEEQQKILHAQIVNLEGTIGKALLPTVKNIVTSMNNWLAKSENQKKIQRDLNAVISTAGTFFHALKDVIDKLSPVIRFATKAVGGLKNAFILLFAVAAISKLRGIAIALGLLPETGIAGGAAKAAVMVGKLRLAMATLYSTAMIGGLGGTLKSVTAIGTALGKLSALARTGLVIGIVLSIKALIDPKSDLFPDSLLGKDSGYGKLKSLLGFGDDSKPVTGPKGGASTGGSGIGHNLPRGNTGQNRKAKSQSEAIAATAATQLGIPYQWGGPPILGHSTDCSGLAQAVLRKSGVSIPRTSQAQWRAGKPVSLGHLQPGDLVFYHMGKGGPEHVAIYIGNGQIIVDPHTGDKVKVDSINGPGTPVGARRYIADVEGGGGGGGGGSTASPTSKSISNAAAAQTLTVGAGLKTKDKKVVWKGATVATITAAKASVTAMITAANQVIGGMAGPMSAIELAAENHLKQLRAKLKIHMSAADLASTKVEIKKWGKVLTNEIATQTKAATRAFQLAGKQLMRAFDKETDRGLKALAAPDETPTERILRLRGEARDDQQRQQALSDAQASGDASAIADALYDIETASLEKQAAAERKAADDKAAADQSAYQDARDDQKEALQQQLDDWEEWLRNKKKTWNEFWKWIHDNPNGGAVTPPNIGSVSDAPTFGSAKPSNNGGFVQVKPNNSGGFVQVGGSMGQVGHPIASFASGGLVPGKLGAPMLAVVHGGEKISPNGGGGDTVIHNIVTLDGRVLYEDWKKQAARDVTRNGGTGVRS